MPTLTETLHFAAQSHEGQPDKAGAPYILHPLRVLNFLPLYFPAPISLEAEQIALLHDVIEDCEVTPAQLREMGYSETVVDALLHLSKTPGEEGEKGDLRSQNEGYRRFIERCAQNSLAARVKLADLHDNLDESRLGQMTLADHLRIGKYRWAKEFLVRSLR